MKKVTTNFEKSNENVLQNTVVKEIQNRVSDKTQGMYKRLTFQYFFINNMIFNNNIFYRC